MLSKYKNILVTGGFGFIGSNLTLDLIKHDSHVTILDNLATGSLENIGPNHKIKFYKRSIFDSLIDIFDQNDFDCVIHLAALGSVPRSISTPVETFESNVYGTVNLLEQVRRKKIPIVFASSSSIYGNSKEPVKHEGLVASPISPYGASKLSGECLIHSYSSVYNFRSISLRFFNVFGPRQNPAGEYAAVIPKFIYKILKNETLEIYGSGNQSRDFTFVKDVTRNIQLILDEDKFINGVANLCYGNSISLNYLIECISELLRKKPKIKFLKPRKGDIMHSIGGNQVIQQLVPKFYQTNFMDALSETIEFYVSRYGD